MGAIQPGDRERSAHATLHRLDELGGEDHGHAGFEWREGQRRAMNGNGEDRSGALAHRRVILRMR